MMNNKYKAQCPKSLFPYSAHLPIWRTVNMFFSHDSLRSRKHLLVLLMDPHASASRADSGSAITAGQFLSVLCGQEGDRKGCDMSRVWEYPHTPVNTSKLP